MEDNRLCKLQVAVQFCICSNMPLFCPSCKATHQAIPDFHFSLPLQACTFVTPYYQQEYKIHFLNLVNSNSKLRENVQALDRFRRDIEEAYKEIYREITQNRDNLLRKVDELKAILYENIESAVQETYENAYRAEYQPSSYLAGLVWTHACQCRSDPIPVLVYEVRVAEERLNDPVDISFYSAIEGFGLYESGGRRLMREIEAGSEGNTVEWERRENNLKSRIDQLESDLKQAKDSINELQSRPISQPSRPANAPIPPPVPRQPKIGLFNPGLPKLGSINAKAEFRSPAK